MKRIFYCWEMGGNLGHLTPAFNMLNDLAEAGHKVYILTVQDFGNQPSLRMLLGKLHPNVKVLERITRPLNKHDWPSNSLLQLFYNRGMNNAELLAAQMREWRLMFSLYQADFVLLDAAPIAGLVARHMGIPRARIGNGFFEALPNDIFTAFDPYSNMGSNPDLEDKVLREVTKALDICKMAPIENARDILDHPAILRTYRGLEHFEQNENACFVGPQPADVFDEVLAIEQNEKPLAIAYLERANPMSLPVIGVAKDAGYNVLTIIGRPVSLANVRGNVELVICHGGNMIAEFATQKTKMLLLPNHPEQNLGCRAAVRSGLQAKIITGRYGSIGEASEFLRDGKKPLVSLEPIENGREKLLNRILKEL